MNTQAQPESTEEIRPHKVIEGLTSIIMPVWISQHYLQHFTGNAIGSIHEHTDPLKTPYEIVLVDDGSPIKLGKLSDYNADKIVVNEENLGYTKAVNAGIRVSQGEYIVVMNNDVMVFDHWLEDFQEALKHIDFVMATPMYGETFSRGREANSKRIFWADKPVEESFSDFNDFSCIGMKRFLLDELGLFDEDYHSYSQDIDFVQRMKAAGKKYASCKRVSTFHVIGASSMTKEDTPIIMDKDKEVYKQKWEGGKMEDTLMQTPRVQADEVPSEEQPQTARIVCSVCGQDNPDQAHLDSHNQAPVGNLIRSDQTGDKIFLVVGEEAHWIMNPETLAALSLSFGNVRTATKDEYGQLRPGEPINLENVEKYK